VIAEIVVLLKESGDNRRVIRWGIVSAGLIANDFCLAMRTLPADEHQVVGKKLVMFSHRPQ